MSANPAQSQPLQPERRRAFLENTLAATPVKIFFTRDGDVMVRRDGNGCFTLILDGHERQYKVVIDGNGAATELSGIGFTPSVRDLDATINSLRATRSIDVSEDDEWRVFFRQLETEISNYGGTIECLRDIISNVLGHRGLPRASVDDLTVDQRSRFTTDLTGPNTIKLLASGDYDLNDSSYSFADPDFERRWDDRLIAFARKARALPQDSAVKIVRAAANPEFPWGSELSLIVEQLERGYCSLTGQDQTELQSVLERATIRFSLNSKRVVVQGETLQISFDVGPSAESLNRIECDLWVASRRHLRMPFDLRSLKLNAVDSNGDVIHSRYVDEVTRRFVYPVPDETYRIKVEFPAGDDLSLS